MRVIDRLVAVGALCALAAAAWPTFAEEAPAPAPTPRYVGVQGCGMCHRSERKGDQLGHWQNSRHAQAYAALASEEARAIGTRMGIDDPQQSDRCLKCHVTAHGVDAALIEPVPEGKKGYSIEDGVGCESCHGPGSLYNSRRVMKDREQALANGLVLPTPELCVKCHNSESPTFQGFDFAAMHEKVKHPNPLAAAGGGEE